MSDFREHAAAGMKAIEEKRFEDAIAAFRRAVELQPERPDMNHALGMAYMHRGETGSAIPHLGRAVELAEPFTEPEVQALKRDFHLQHAAALQLMDHVAQAEQALRRAVELWPDQPEPKLPKRYSENDFQGETRTLCS